MYVKYEIKRLIERERGMHMSYKKIGRIRAFV